MLRTDQPGSGFRCRRHPGYRCGLHGRMAGRTGAGYAPDGTNATLRSRLSLPCWAAFKLSDPEKLLGGEEDLGITCALIPTSTPGVEIGRRHFPLNVPFQNGPTRGQDIFVPIDYIIGGPKMAGQGWRMLVECLSVGRGITLPSNSTGGLKSVAMGIGAYAHIRRQFKISIGKMEGIEAAGAYRRQRLRDGCRRVVNYLRHYAG